MTDKTSHLINLCMSNWFVLLLLFIVSINIYGVLTSSWSDPAFVERVVLISFCIIIPLLYPFCYRSGIRRMLIRMAALSFLGVWGASALIPDEHHFLLNQLVPLRYLGIVVLFVIEIKLLVMMLQFITSHDDNDQRLSQQLAEKGDLPEWYARLMAYEAAFWRRLLNGLKRLFRHG